MSNVSRLGKRAETPAGQAAERPTSAGRSAAAQRSAAGARAYRFGAPEATRMARAIVERYEPSAQRKVVKELFARATNDTLRLTREAATVLNRLAKSVGAQVQFSAREA